MTPIKTKAELTLKRIMEREVKTHMGWMSQPVSTEGAKKVKYTAILYARTAGAVGLFNYVNFDFDSQETDALKLDAEAIKAAVASGLEVNRVHDVMLVVR